MKFSFNREITLENDRVSLRPLKKEDFGLLENVASEDHNLLQYSPSRIYPVSKLIAYIDRAVEGRSERVRYPFIVFDKEHGKYAGSTSFGNVSNPDFRLEIGWTWIGPGFQGTGLNKNMKFLMLQYAFDVLNCERVEFKIDANNMASRRAVEKIGGSYEGLLRSHILKPDGVRRNTVYYSILSGEWQESKTSVFKEFISQDHAISALPVVDNHHQTS